MHNGIMRVVRVRDASPYIMGISMRASVLPPFRRGLRYILGVRDISVFMCPVGHGEKPSNGLRGTRARRRCMSVPLARRMHRLYVSRWYIEDRGSNSFEKSPVMSGGGRREIFV